MRLLQLQPSGEVTLTKDFLSHEIPPYAILSHTWGFDEQEVSFADFARDSQKTKSGYKKILFCTKQALADGLEYCWVDTCCIDKSNYTEYAEAINSMFRWYRNAAKCYAYLSDVSLNQGVQMDKFTRSMWEPAFRRSKWFTRGWTLQELIAPSSVEFFSLDGQRLGDKKSLEDVIYNITYIPVNVLRGASFSTYGVEERIMWSSNRRTTRPEDKAYSLLGLFGVHMPPIYGEGEHEALDRLRREISSRSAGTPAPPTVSSTGANLSAHELVSWTSAIFHLQNENSHKLMAVSAQSMDNDAHIQQYWDCGTQDHLWQLMLTPGGWVKVRNMRSGLVLAVEGQSMNDNAFIRQYEDNGTWDHLWRLELRSSDGLFLIRNRNSGKVVAIEGQSVQDTANLVQMEENGSRDQLWRFLPPDQSWFKMDPEWMCKWHE